MSLLDRLQHQALYLRINEGEEVKDPNEYLFASLTQPPLKVVKKYDSDDEMKWDVECPNCGKVINYGEEIFMISGHHYCINEGCREKLVAKLEGRSKQ